MDVIKSLHEMEYEIYVRMICEVERKMTWDKRSGMPRLELDEEVCLRIKAGAKLAASIWVAE